jgi:MoxR-like ATPase
LFRGESGCGKSETIRKFAYLLRRKLAELCVIPETEPSALIGQLAPNEKKGVPAWLDGVVTEAFRNDFWVLLDNLNQAEASVLVYNYLVENILS